MWAELAAGGALGLVSSLHCAQMCGPIVLAFSLNGRAGWVTHAAYHAGRIATYTLLGAFAGALGSTLSGLAGVERSVTLAAGVLLIVAGVLLGSILPGSKQLIQIRMPGPLSRLTSKMLVAPGWSRKLVMGLAMGLLPCGLIYAALIQAAAAGHALGGAATMAAFGVATSGSLLAIGGLSPVFKRLRWTRYTTQLTTVTLVLMGSILLWRGYSWQPRQPACHDTSPQQHHH